MMDNEVGLRLGSWRGDDIKGFTSLMYAATQVDTTPLLEMIASGYAEASLFVKDMNGRTALDWARVKKNTLAIAVLSKAMKRSLDAGRLALIESAADTEVKAHEANRLQSELLLKKLHLRDEDGVMAALSENIQGRGEVVDENNTGGIVFRDIVEALDEVFFTDIPDSLGSTPLMLAAGRNMMSAVFRLISLGAPINESNKHGHNPLIWACICGHVEVIKALLLQGADINHRTAEGRTALHYCCLYSKAKAAFTLMEFMFEKFQLFRLDHPRNKPDPSRWSKYATIMETFLNIKDNERKKAVELIPHSNRVHDIESVDRLSAASFMSFEAASQASQASFSKLTLRNEEIRDDILPLPPGFVNADSSLYRLDDDDDSFEKASQVQPLLHVSFLKF